MNENSKRTNSTAVRFAGSAIIFCVVLFGAGTTQAQIQPGQTSLPPDQQQAEPRQNQALSSQPAAVARNLDPSAYEPITASGRVHWWVHSLIGPESLTAGLFVAGYQTARNQPAVWGPHWDGFGKRYGMRLSNIGVSNAIQGGVGSLWGEDPRYFRSGASAMSGRLRHVVMGVVEAKYRDGHYGPNVSYYIGSVSGNFISNEWRPAEQTTTGATFGRVGTGILGKLVSNAFKEFWPDVQEHVFHRGQ